MSGRPSALQIEAGYIKAARQLDGTRWIPVIASKIFLPRDATVLARALATPSYVLLGVGFLVCGFHVAFLATHLPGVVEQCGMPPAIAGWSLAVIGLFNIVGSLAMGWAVGHWRMKSLLSLLYTVRGIAVLVFVATPKTPVVMLVFAAVMGLTFLSTVPPTIGLVAKIFGPANMAMLYGVLMLGHQVGGFLGAFLGGQAFHLDSWTR